VEDILQFFEGYEIREGSVKLDAPRPGATNPPGAATIKFVHWKEAAKAVAALNGKPMGSRWIGLQLL
jgi:hypothetical protein